MADENIERWREHFAEQPARSAAIMRELEDIVAQFERATHDRVKANEQLDSQPGKKEKVKKTDDTFASLIADLERNISERRNGKST